RLSGYRWGTVIRCSRIASRRMPSSSSISRTRASSGVSPGSRLPPGNSQRPARSRPSVRRVSRMRPRVSRMTAAITSMLRIGSCPHPPFGHLLPQAGEGNLELPMAVLELLPAAAGAGFVAADVGELRVLARAAADALRLPGNRRGGEGTATGTQLLGFLVGAVAAGIGMLELHAAGLGLGLGA